ncbi:hypothetical protein CVT25_009917 [Psilocybe cyanescens]|uniref:WW domain-containing protein n=1 Tax=Psilocybe cyanescens TaxID=93625 RepID=A0A409XCK6_PSICY|nr:hypothetical protein CVT25_009917 [Psilocybe cyanescens]
MEEETETLDWGQEEEEQQLNQRKTSFDQNTRGDYGDADDVEDTVSLGEDEDEPIYYNQPQDATRSAHDAGAAADVPERPPSSQRREDNSGANDQRSYRDNSREAERLESSASRDSRITAESPPRQLHSGNHSSPQRHQQNGTRITHALPPKPAIAQVPYLPPSHPSMVEAIGMASTSISPPNRSTLRDSKKLNGTPGRPGSSPMPADLPPDWQTRYSRNGQMYYYNPETEETTWDFPVSNLPSTSTLGGSQRRRRPSASSGHMHLTPPDSNNHHSQTSRAKRQHSHPQADSELKDQAKLSTPDPDNLSYEDRHYRPGGEAPSVPLEIRGPERLDGPVIRPHPKLQYDRSPSPPRQRRRPRSISPQPDSRGPANEKDYPPIRGNGRPARDRNVYTNPDPVFRREIDAMPPHSGISDRHWEPAPHAPVSDFSRNERGSRRPPHRDEDFMLESRSSDNRNRPSVRRRESSRGPRDREPPRPSDRRDKPSENQNFIPAPRYRSPPRTHERDPGRDHGPPPPEVGEAYPGPPTQIRRDRDRPSHFEQLAPPGPPPPGGPSNRREPYNERPRNYDMPPSFEQPRHREERGVERSRRDPLPADAPNIRPPQNSYPGEHNRMPVDRIKRFADDYNQVRPEESSRTCIFQDRCRSLSPKTCHRNLITALLVVFQ